MFIKFKIRSIKAKSKMYGFWLYTRPKTFTSSSIFGLNFNDIFSFLTNFVTSFRLEKWSFLHCEAFHILYTHNKYNIIRSTVSVLIFLFDLSQLISKELQLNRICFMMLAMLHHEITIFPVCFPNKLIFLSLIQEWYLMIS